MKSISKLLLLGFLSVAAQAVEHPVYLMPMNCAELVPDSGPFLGFFESLGRGVAATNRNLSKRIFRILSLRERLVTHTGRAGEANPVDPLIRKFLCFYREQRDPLRMVTYDDKDFIQFVNKEMPTLEKRVDDAMFQVALEEQGRKEYERRISTQRAVIDAIREEADREAERLYDKFSSAAQKKVRNP